MKKQIQILILLGTINLYGFEVNTHQALTRCAITTECNQEGSKNLDTFVSNAGISKGNIYEKQFFEHYKYKGKPVTYNNYIKNAEAAMSDFQVKVKGDYKGMIEAGVILEDAIYHNGANSADGRFNNHFYAAQIEDTKAECHKTDIPLFVALAAMGRTTGAAVGAVALGNTELMRTNKALCMGLGARTDNIDWVLNKNVNLGFNRVNDYGLDDTFSYFKNSFVGTKANRTKYQAKLFTSLGFMIHLLQDLHSPAHCRDGSHPKGDYLEIYGRYDGGFYLRNGTFANTKNNSAIKQAIAQMDMKKTMLKDNKFVSYQDFYNKEADWVSSNFFSESHTYGESPNKETGEGLEINNFLDSDTIFDGYNPLPSTSTTYENDKDEIITTGNTISHVKGELISFDGLNEKPIALIDRSIFGSVFDNEHMIMPTYHMDYRKKKMVRGKDNTRALEMTSINVMPRAIASSQAFINFFFRGQMEAGLSEDHTQLVVKNVSKTDLVYSSKLLTYKRGGKFTLYVEKSGVNDFIGTYTLNSDMKVNETRNINIGNIIENKGIQAGAKITVVYDGNIGGYNQYDIGMRGLSARVFTVKKKPECKNKKLEAQIKQVQKWLKEDNRKHCVMFSPLNYRIKAKSVWTSTSKMKCNAPQSYKNTEMGEYINNFHRLDDTDLIDYFNKNVYHIDFEEEIQDRYTAGTGYSPRNLPSGDFDVSFTVTQNKNGEYYHTYNLAKLLTFTYLPSNAHIRAPHYHITCNSSKSLCNYLKRQGIGQNFNESQVDNLAPYDFLASPYLKIYAVGDVIKALNKYYGEYYGKSFKDDKYPKDWLKKMVDWIESYDCKKTEKLNIFYDETHIQKTNEFKGL